MNEALCAKGLLIASADASKDDDDEIVSPTSGHAEKLTFAEQKELLLLQLENRKLEH